MKKKLTFAALLLGIFSLSSNAQNFNFMQATQNDQKELPAYEFTPSEYQQLKETNSLPEGNISILIGAPDPHATPMPSSAERGGGASCGCYIEPDATYTLAMAPNDDGSTGLISLPFNFCLYGTNYNSLYINNNGNVSFGTPYGTFSSSPFPSASYTMVAPFWGDVDTRGAGQVWYKITTNAIYVNWVGVGYYSYGTDKLNTFQLILTDGTDPFVGVGNNVAFCYQSMEWTTGAASSGVNGFGGIPATVGANLGNGVDYIQFGRFDQPGAAYDGPFGANDGVDWLDNGTFRFNTCVAGTNIAPILAGVQPSTASGSGSGIACGDTLSICGLDDTLIMEASFIAPENGQTVTVTASAPTLTNFQVLNSSNGTITMMVVSDLADAGWNTITVTATDDGTPAMSTSFPITMYIDTVGLSNFNPTITGPDSVCTNQVPVTLSTQTTYDSYIWSTGSTTSSTTLSTSDTTWLTVEQTGCFKSLQHILTVLPDPVPTILGNTTYCITDGGTSLGSGSTESTYEWEFQGSVIDTDSSVLVTSPGTYTLTVSNALGCSGSTTATVVSSDPTVNITASNPSPICQGTSTVLTANTASGVAISWSTGSTASSITVNTSGTYIVTTSLGSCTDADTMVISVVPSPTPAILGDTIFCIADGGTNLASDSSYNTYSWVFQSGVTGTDSLLFATAGGTYTLNVTDNTGCTGTTTFNLAVTDPNVSINSSVPQPMCQGTSTILSATGTTGNSYLWSTGSSNASITANTSGVYSVSATLNGCTVTDSLTVTVMPIPDVVISGPPSICSGQNTYLAANSTSAGVTFSWNTGSTADSILVTTAGTYIVTVSNGTCQSSDTVQLAVVATPTGFISGLLEFCAGTVSTLTANFSPSAEFSWSTGDTTQSIQVSTSGEYSVVVNNSGCIGTDTVDIIAHPLPNAGFSVSPSGDIFIGTTVMINDNSTIGSPDNIVSWTYVLEDTIVSILPDFSQLFSTSGDYPLTLYVMSSFGCVDSVTQIISVIEELEIPNVFTPGVVDGSNDLFTIRSLEFYPNSSLKIFNRWGQIVFEDPDYKNNWNGTKMNDGKLVSTGTYYYIFTLEDNTVYTGTVTIFTDK